MGCAASWLCPHVLASGIISRRLPAPKALGHKFVIKQKERKKTKHKVRCRSVVLVVEGVTRGWELGKP